MAAELENASAVIHVELTKAPEIHVELRSDKPVIRTEIVGKGPVGERGPQGVQGPPGAMGATGPRGETGPKGDPFTYEDFTQEQLAALKGPKGDTGATGPQGEQGDPFTYEDFTPEQLAALTGPQGAKGETGATGATGPVGPQGETGATGATGPAGPGVPAGGTQHQILWKASATDFDTEWRTLRPSDIGAAKEWTLVWENASPSSAFAAQTIPLDLSGYTEVKIVFAYSKSNLTSASFVLGEVGFTVYPFLTSGLTDSSPVIRRRSATISSTGIDFGASQYKNIGTNAGNTNNDYMIPLTVWAR